MEDELQGYVVPADQDLTGEYVKIVSQVPLWPLDTAEFAPEARAEKQDVNGQPGRVLGWASEEALAVETFSGYVFGVPPGDLRLFEPKPGQDGGFDVAWHSGEDLEWTLGTDIAEKLVTNGFCVVQLCLRQETRDGAADAAAERSDWKRLIEELEPGYLGRSAAGKVAWLDQSDDREAQNGLEVCDQMLTLLAGHLQPVAQRMFGFEVADRSDGLLRRPCADAAEEAQLKAARERLDSVQIESVGRVEDHLRFVQQRRIAAMLFVSGGGSLVLHPKEGADVVVPCDENKLVLFRHDRFGYTYEPGLDDYVTLQAWLLSEDMSTVMEEYSGPQERLDEALGVLTGPPAPRYGVTGSSVSLMSIDCMLACNGLGAEFFTAALFCGTDGGRHLSDLRWDPDMYFEPNKDMAFGKYYSNHGGFVLEETFMAFDPKFFGIKEEECYQIDPCHRNTMEVGYNILYKAGWNRTSLNGAAIGVYIGNCGTDWSGVRLNPAVPWYPVNEEYLNSFSAHMCNARLSYIFGMRGPLSTSDTACSSSLVATGTSMNALRRVEPDQLRVSNCSDTKWSLVMGTNLLIGPFSWIGLCGPRMLSARGRCFTFDHSADGFGRGEGTSGLTMKVTDGEPSGRLAMFCGTCINQDGRSASMTAPHGPSQQECIKASMREANIVPSDVRVAELHGTGTALGDPIEVGALRGVMRKRSLPIIKTSAKSNLEHGEANAGMAGLVKCVILLTFGTTPPNIHLKDLNPHIDANNYPVMFSDEMTDLGSCSGFAGVSSFGFGGTNARGDIWARASAGQRRTGDLDQDKMDYILVRCAHCMGWMDHVGGQMMPTAAPKPPNGRYRAHTIRDEHASYSWCSLCYEGRYQFGEPIKETDMPEGRVYITGTWDAWSNKTEVLKDENGAWTHLVRLGETRTEQFHFMLEENPTFAIFPACPLAGMEVRTEGPSQYQEGHHWLIDGRDRDWPEGTLLKITLAIDAVSGARRVSWEAIPEAGGPAEFFPYRHDYYVRGSFTANTFVRMNAVPSLRNTYEYTLRFGVTGQETFQLARDGSEEQVIYPAQPNAQQANVPVRGPDALGHTKSWIVFGDQNTTLTIRLQVRNGQLKVTTMGADGTKAWQSVEGPARRVFHVSGVTGGNISMEPEEGTPDVYKAQVTMTQDAEDFQILVDEDPKCAIYPELEGQPCGHAFVCGPDANAKGSKFRIEAGAGSLVEIVLDLRCDDRRWIVRWVPIGVDGTPDLPWSAGAKFAIRDTPGR